MSETSLYRRHRPQSFDEVVGQDAVVRTLRNAVERDRVHHAYLFVGSRGTGKTSMAKILARCLNCERGPTTAPCGQCESCRVIAAGTSLDVIEMDAASNRSVDDIRDLRERVGYVPASGKWKVYIIDEAHMLTREAWNAFLKTLEEPPPNTVFVLATTEAHKVMPTIVDRCQRFDFQRPSAGQIAGVVERVSESEGIEIADGAVAAIARSAGGSFRDALGTLDQLVAYGGSPVSTDDVLAVLGVADAELIFGAAGAIAAGDGKAVLATVAELAASGRDATRYIRDLIAHLRQLLVVRTSGAVPDAIAVTAESEQRIREQADGIGEVTLVRAIDELSAALSSIREWGDDSRAALELALLKAARPEIDPSVEALAQRVERVERGLTGPPAAPGREAEEAAGLISVEDTRAPSSEPEAEAPVAGEPLEEEEAGEDRPQASSSTPAPRDSAEPEPPRSTATQATAVVEVVDLERVAGLWPAVLDHVRQTGSELLSAVFEAARPTAVDAEGAIVEIGFPPSAAFNKRKAEARANQERLAEALRTIVGESLRPVYVLIEADDGAHANGEAQMTDDELVERIKSEFDAEERAAAGEEEE